MAVNDPVSGPGVVNGRGAGGYYELKTTTDAWVYVDFGFSSMNQMFVNDSTNSADISWDHDTLATHPVHAMIKQNEKLEFYARSTRGVWIKSTVASSATNLRIIAW